MSGRRFHHPPGFNLLHPARAQTLQAHDFGFNVIRLDVQMHAAGMRNRLHFHVQHRVWIDQPHVFLAFLAGQGLYGHSQRAAPELRSSPEIFCLTIDYEASQLALVHVNLLSADRYRRLANESTNATERLRILDLLAEEKAKFKLEMGREAPLPEDDHPSTRQS